MIAIHLDGVTVTYVDAPIFANLSWDVHDDRCVGLVANGEVNRFCSDYHLESESPTPIERMI